MAAPVHCADETSAGARITRYGKHYSPNGQREAGGPKTAGTLRT
jgi:hypothetical protein